MAQINWKSQAEIDAEKAEQERQASLPDDKERIAQLEEMVLQLLLMA